MLFKTKFKNCNFPLLIPKGGLDIKQTQPNIESLGYIELESTSIILKKVLNDFYVLSADKDECNVNSGGCDIVNGLCINTPGSYHCQCKQGYQLRENSELICEGK